MTTEITTASEVCSVKKVNAHGDMRGLDPKSLANLRPYPPGVNGNPKPGNSLKASLLNALGEPLKEPASDAPAREHIVYATLKGAIKCEPTSAHLKEVWDRVEGKVPDKGTPQAVINNLIVNVTSPESKKLLEKTLSGYRTVDANTDSNESI